MKKNIKWFALLLVMITLVACGGGGGGGTPAPDNNDNPADENETPGVGTFGKYDGLIYYTNQTDNGITSDGGKFNYEDGETVAFWLNYEKNVFLGYATAKSGMAITDLAINAEWVNQETVDNIRSFLEALDIDANPLNGVVITEEQRNRIQEPVDFTLPRAKFIRQYAHYAEYIAGDTGATGNIGQTESTFNITLSKGVTLFFPVDLLITGVVTPSPNNSTVLGTKKWVDDDESRSGVYAVGLNPGVATLNIYKTGYVMSFNITVVDTAVYPEFSGTVIDYLGGNGPVLTENVSYTDYLNTLPVINLIEALTNMKIILKPGEY